MRVGTLVILDPILYTDMQSRIGIVTKVMSCGERFHILWNDGSEAILGIFDLEVLCT